MVRLGMYGRYPVCARKKCDPGEHDGERRDDNRQREACILHSWLAKGFDAVANGFDTCQRGASTCEDFQ